MEGVVVEVRVRASCKRFAIKDNGICDRSARGFDGHNAKPHSFFSLRTMRVVTRTSANLSRVPSGLPTNEWRADSRVVSAMARIRQSAHTSVERDGHVSVARPRCGVQCVGVSARQRLTSTPVASHGTFWNCRAAFARKPGLCSMTVISSISSRANHVQ